jgi:hypothetical protein
MYYYYVRKRWRVIARTRHGCKEAFELRERWSYELAEAEEIPEEEPEGPRHVTANTRYGGLRMDIDLGERWTERQVHEAIRNSWAGELAQKSEIGGNGSTTDMVTRNERQEKMQFAVRENWTYDIMDDVMSESVKNIQYRPRPTVADPKQMILVGIQLEDGPRLERHVRQDTTEQGPRIFMWKELGRPQRTRYLYMRDASDPEREDFQIGHQWTYIFRRQPRAQLKNKLEPKRVDGKSDPKSATRTMREEQIVSKSSGAGASKTAAQGKGEQRGKSTEARAAASGGSRTSRVTVGSPWKSVE